MCVCVCVHVLVCIIKYPPYILLLLSVTRGSTSHLSKNLHLFMLPSGSKSKTTDVGEEVKYAYNETS